MASRPVAGHRRIIPGRLHDQDRLKPRPTITEIFWLQAKQLNWMQCVRWWAKAGPGLTSSEHPGQKVGTVNCGPAMPKE